MVFDSLNKGISVYEKYGEDRGAYFIERLNLKRLQVQDLHDRVLIVEQSLKSYHKRLDGMNLNIKTDQ